MTDGSRSVHLGGTEVAIIDGDRGKNYPSKKELKPNGFCLFLNAGNVTLNGFSFSSCEFIDSDRDAKLRNGRLSRDDSVLTTRGTVGNVAFFGPDIRYEYIRINSGMVILRPDKTSVFPRYLAFFLRSTIFSDQVKSLTSGSAQPQLPVRDIRQVEMPLPSLDRQKQIAAILGALDDKIELNRRMSATLEEMARALYRSWFVDFDPVHVRALGQSPAHMAPTTAALFPDGFGPDGLPKGWEVSSIYDFARVQYGAAFKSTKFNSSGDGRPLVRIRDLKRHRAGVYTTEFHKKEHLIQPGDTVVGMDGDFTAYSWCNSPVLMNQRVCSFLPTAPGNRAFVRYGIVPLLKSEEDAAVATTVIHLGKKDIDKFTLLNPGDTVLAAFSSVCEPLLERTVQLGLESKTLATLRDTLLPRLMSGDLRIREAEKRIEDFI